MEKETTILIKTFERPKNLSRLLVSIFKYYKDIAVIVVDDGKDREINKNKITSRFKNKKITYLTLPYDSGLGAGRNAGLEKVETKYFVLCDDDFVFDKRTDLVKMRKIIEKNKFDLVSGVLYEPKTTLGLLPKKLKTAFNFLQRAFFAFIYDSGFEIKFKRELSLCANFDHNPEQRKIALIKHPCGKGINKHDIVINFFMCKTSIRDSVMWRPELKLIEHGVFFWDFKKAGFKACSSNEVGVNHLRDMGFSYRKKRYRKDLNKYVAMQLDAYEVDEIDGAFTMIKRTKDGYYIKEKKE